MSLSIHAVGRLLLAAAVGLLASPLFAAPAAPTATRAYQDEVNTIVATRVAAALFPHVDTIRRAGSGAVALKFRVRASGEVETVTLTQRHPSRFVNKTIMQIVSTTKLPRIPAKVLSEQGHPWVEVTTEIQLR